MCKNDKIIPWSLPKLVQTFFSGDEKKKNLIGFKKSFGTRFSEMGLNFHFWATRGFQKKFYKKKYNKDLKKIINKS